MVSVLVVTQLQCGVINLDSMPLSTRTSLISLVVRTFASHLQGWGGSASIMFAWSLYGFPVCQKFSLGSMVSSTVQRCVVGY